MNYDEALNYMQGLRRFGVKLGNERFEALLYLLGNPHQRFCVIHVAGTKGKGSTTAIISAILLAHGLKVGSYYSPYVYDVRERVQVNGEMIPREDFARIVSKIAPLALDLEAQGLGPTTEFELKTAVGFVYFAEQKVDIAAVEVGLGGRLDATNVVSPAACIITNIGLDHTHILGHTYSLIAGEKAGIIKPGIPVVTATDNPEALEVIRRIANERSAPLTLALNTDINNPPTAGEIHCSSQDDLFTITTSRARYSNLHCGLYGRIQHINAACAIGALEEWSSASGGLLRQNAVLAGLSAVSLPGRMEIVHCNPAVIMDGAHNGMSAKALAEEIRRMHYRKLLLVLGMVSGHDPAEVVEALAPLAERVYATQPTWIRGLPAERIAAAVRMVNVPVEVVTPPAEAARLAFFEAQENDLVLVTGSFYTVGDVPATVFRASRSASMVE